MPITHAAAKALRQGAKLRRRNVAEKEAINKLIKQAHKALAAKKTDVAADAARKAGKAIDKAVAHGILKRNTAARLKSRLTKKLNAAKKA